MTSEPVDITTLIRRWQSGDSEAADRLIDMVYPELKRIAGAYLRNERPDHTLEPTALVNELYVKLIASSPLAVQNRTHFFAVAAEALRHILVDYARVHNARKRGGNNLKVTLSASGSDFPALDEDMLAVDEVLKQLQQLDPRAAQVVELRFFGGLREEEVGEVLGVSKITVQRDWRAARAWMMSQLMPRKKPHNANPL